MKVARYLLSVRMAYSFSMKPEKSIKTFPADLPKQQPRANDVSII